MQHARSGDTETAAGPSMMASFGMPVSPSPMLANLPSLNTRCHLPAGLSSTEPEPNHRSVCSFSLYLRIMWQNMLQNVQSKLNEPSEILSFAPAWIVSVLLLIGAVIVSPGSFMP